MAYCLCFYSSPSIKCKVTRELREQHLLCGERNQFPVHAQNLARALDCHHAHLRVVVAQKRLIRRGGLLTGDTKKTVNIRMLSNDGDMCVIARRYCTMR